ncbi:hypothetical protein N7462_000398 [Penicillium macrosclerotiorum]|uniref:uncharacterized protein n=1 Tax=Penicillium macrosclerotiorum TaxID=303699 RepID=UPI0025496152|nr:uncharacterized protein N7462_000398 [Penicillium macrosclerotiorum]KAJ5698393.1 hypothetical protein N7462_000398 [Penicillium macrosclerotiorum]
MRPQPSDMELARAISVAEGWHQQPLYHWARRINNRNRNKNKKTYNSRDSLVVTHPTTNLPACGLSTAERTGSPVLHTLWSYVLEIFCKQNMYKAKKQK